MFIQDGDHVIICTGDYFRSLTIDANQKETVDGTQLCLKNAIGVPYGTQFAVCGDQIQPISNRKPTHIKDAVVSLSTESRDNRNITDNTENQKLNYQDIKSMQDTGAAGDEILTKLIAGNSNFEKKTMFSQEKYVSKKRKKHMGLFTIEKPCSRILCDLYSKFRKEKCLGLRFDTLCHILTYANIHAGSTVLLAETCGGLVLGAVLERLGVPSLGGSVIQFFHGTSPPRPEINPSVLSSYDQQVCPVSLFDVMSYLSGKVPILSEDENPSVSNLVEPEIDENTATLVDRGMDSDDKHVGICSNPNNDQSVRRMQRLAKKRVGYNRLVGSNAVPADALIVATRFHPVDLTLVLMQFLPIGKPVVVYSPYLQPLVQLYNSFKQRGGMAHMRLSDSWFRPIQVLPDRTHPHVTMMASGGYLLCAYMVEPKPSTSQLLASGLIASTKIDEF